MSLCKSRRRGRKWDIQLAFSQTKTASPSYSKSPAFCTGKKGFFKIQNSSHTPSFPHTCKREGFRNPSFIQNFWSWDIYIYIFSFFFSGNPLLKFVSCPFLPVSVLLVTWRRKKATAFKRRRGKLPIFNFIYFQQYYTVEIALCFPPKKNHLGLRKLVNTGGKAVEILPSLPVSSKYANIEFSRKGRKKEKGKSREKKKKIPTGVGEKKVQNEYLGFFLPLHALASRKINNREKESFRKFDLFSPLLFFCEIEGRGRSIKLFWKGEGVKGKREPFNFSEGLSHSSIFSVVTSLSLSLSSRSFYVLATFCQKTFSSNCEKLKKETSENRGFFLFISN